MIRARAGLLLGIVMMLARTAHAEPAPADRALATDLFDQARTLVADGKLAEACPKFAESQRLDPAPGTLLNLANCHELEGKTATAWTEFNEALAVAERERQADRVAFAEAHIKALAVRLSRLVVIVPPELEGKEIEVTRDGSLIPRIALATATPIDPGLHRIEVTARGFVPWFTEVTIADGERREVTLGPLAPAPAAPSASAEVVPVVPAGPQRSDATNDAPMSRTRIAALATGGAGLLALGVGGVAGILAISQSSRSASRCNPRCNDEGYDLNQSAKTAADVATASFVIGAALVATGIVLYFVSRRDPPTTASLRF